MKLHIKDRNYFEALLPRIYELGGKLPDDIRSFADQAGCPDAHPAWAGLCPPTSAARKPARDAPRRRRAPMRWVTLP